MKAYVDAGHTTCTDNRQSVSPEAIILGDAAISYFSRSQKAIIRTAVATPGAEYVAMGEALKEAPFLPHLQPFITTDVEKYSVLIVDYNQACIKLANNPFASKRARHIDIVYNLVSNYANKGSKYCLREDRETAR